VGQAVRAHAKMAENETTADLGRPGSGARIGGTKGPLGAPDRKISDKVALPGETDPFPSFIFISFIFFYFSTHPDVLAGSRYQSVSGDFFFQISSTEAPPTS
jgi:hypothetical protein